MREGERKEEGAIEGEGRERKGRGRRRGGQGKGEGREEQCDLTCQHGHVLTLHKPLPSEILVCCHPPDHP